MRGIAAVLCLVLGAAPLRGQSVEARDGDLFFRAGCDAGARRLTSSGADSDPELSPDGRTVAFVRGDPAGGTSLWTIRADGTGARRWVTSTAGDTVPERTLARFQSPRFSPDGRRIYFLSDAWATSGAVHVLELATGAERYVIPGNSLEVARAGRYAGYLLVTQHRYFDGGGSYDWFWLFTPDGREVRTLGDDDDAVDRFRATYLPPRRC